MYLHLLPITVNQRLGAFSARAASKGRDQKSWQARELLHDRTYIATGAFMRGVQRSEAFYYLVWALMRAVKIHSHFVMGLVLLRGRCREVSCHYQESTH